MQAGNMHGPGRLALWWRRALAHRRQVALAVIDMHERYGAAAYGIARRSAGRGGTAERRFWRRVARRLRRGPRMQQGWV
jgi:hypothetical protein